MTNISTLLYLSIMETNNTKNTNNRKAHDCDKQQPNSIDLTQKLMKHFQYLQKKYHIKEIAIHEIQMPKNNKHKPIVEFVAVFKKPIDLLTLVNLEMYLSRTLHIRAKVTTKKALELYYQKYKSEKPLPTSS